MTNTNANGKRPTSAALPGVLRRARQRYHARPVWERPALTQAIINLNLLTEDELALIGAEAARPLTARERAYLTEPPAERKARLRAEAADLWPALRRLLRRELARLAQTLFPPR